jgi:hypothetical protein
MVHKHLMLTAVPTKCMLVSELKPLVLPTPQQDPACVLPL